LEWFDLPQVDSHCIMSE